MRVRLTDDVLRARIVALLKVWPGGATTGNAIRGYCASGNYAPRIPALLDALVAEGTIERCKFEEAAVSVRGSYRRTMQGYRLVLPPCGGDARRAEGGFPITPTQPPPSRGRSENKEASWPG